MLPMGESLPSNNKNNNDDGGGGSVEQKFKEQSQTRRWGEGGERGGGRTERMRTCVYAMRANQISNKTFSSSSSPNQVIFKIKAQKLLKKFHNHFLSFFLGVYIK